MAKSEIAQLLHRFFFCEGIEYNLGRIPMASCDFSKRTYTYDDVDEDFELNKFALADEDINYKVMI